MGTGTWELGHGNWDMGTGTWDSGMWDRIVSMQGVLKLLKNLVGSYGGLSW